LRIYKCGDAIINLQKISIEMIKWEENIRFSRCPPEYLLVKSCLVGLIGNVLDQIFGLHQILSSPQPNLTIGKNGKYWEINPIDFSDPDGWSDMVHDLVREAVFDSELNKLKNSPLK
jgi:hypothetical protein